MAKCHYDSKLIAKLVNINGIGKQNTAFISDA